MRTIALVLHSDQHSEYSLLDSFSDEQEVECLERLQEELPEVLVKIYEERKEFRQKEEEFSDYLETVLSQPFVHPEVMKKATDWFRSKNRIDELKKMEEGAKNIIVQYALQIFMEKPERTDFILKSSRGEVRIRIHVLQEEVMEESWDLESSVQFEVKKFGTS